MEEAANREPDYTTLYPRRQTYSNYNLIELLTKTLSSSQNFVSLREAIEYIPNASRVLSSGIELFITFKSVSNDGLSYVDLLIQTLTGLLKIRHNADCSTRHRVTLQLTVSQSVCLGVEPRTRYFFL
jgi:hypothetical protein